MQFAALSSVKHRVHLGAPLPFNVRNADKTLLLARGQQVQSHEQLDALFVRGALVDLAELQTARDEVQKASRQQLPRLWAQNMDRVTLAIQNSEVEDFGGALDEVSGPVLGLIERDPDLAIFQVLRQGAGAETDYGARRSLHTAITAQLVAQRLGWQAEDCTRMFKVALTMNLSMLALQGELAQQSIPPTPMQRKALMTHPMRSVQMLELAGVDDRDWLRAVLDHHETTDGSGYPSGRSEIGDLASLAHRADVYTSKLASRSTRVSMAADVAGRQMFMQDPGHPMTAALVKEFGIYPPGCHVRLVSGELAIVVARGPTVTSPVVACLTNGKGQTLSTPHRVDTSHRAHAVVAVVGENSVSVRLPVEQLLKLATA